MVLLQQKKKRLAFIYNAFFTTQTYYTFINTPIKQLHAIIPVMAHISLYMLATFRQCVIF